MPPSTQTATQTTISQVHPDRILVRGYNLAELAGAYSFGDVVYLLMSGELPPNREGALIEAILVTATGQVAASSWSCNSS